MEAFQTEDTIKFPVSKKRILLDWLVCLGLFAGSYLSYKFLPAFSAILFLGGAIGSIYFPIFLLHNKSGLYLNKDGINITTPLLKKSFVKWDQIVHFSFYKISNATMIAVHIADPGSYMKKYSIWAKIFGNMSNRGSDEYYYHIDPATYGCNAEELSELLQQKHKIYKISIGDKHYGL